MHVHEVYKEKQRKDDLDWLSQRMTEVTQEEANYFCGVLKDALSRDLMLLDARNYALGRLMGHDPSSWVMVRSPIPH